MKIKSKLTIFLFLVLSTSSTVFAEDNQGNLPLCTDPIVILNPGLVPCKLSLNPPTEFNIPELKLDFDNLDQIFMGAESSGGRVINPLGTDRSRTLDIPRPEFTKKVSLSCQARLISDGGKTVSFLSIQNFNLSNNNLKRELFLNNWKHFVMQGNQFFPIKKYKVPVAPSLNLKNYVVKIFNNRIKNKLGLEVCKSTLSGKVTTCSEIEKGFYEYKLQATLTNKVINTKKNLTTKQKLKIICYNN